MIDDAGQNLRRYAARVRVAREPDASAVAQVSGAACANRREVTRRVNGSGLRRPRSTETNDRALDVRLLDLLRSDELDLNVIR